MVVVQWLLALDMGAVTLVKTWTWLVAFHIELVHLGRVWLKYTSSIYEEIVGRKGILILVYQ